MKVNCEMNPTMGPTGRSRFRLTTIRSRPQPMFTVFSTVVPIIRLLHVRKKTHTKEILNEYTFVPERPIYKPTMLMVRLG